MKAKIFYGDRLGKTRTAKRIMEEFGLDKSVLISGRNKKTGKINDDPFLFHACTKDTKLIVFDDCHQDFDYFYFNEVFMRNNEGELFAKLNVNKLHEKPFTIEVPQLIFTTEFIPKFFPASQYFEFYNFTPNIRDLIEKVVSELNSAEKKHPDWPINIFEQVAIMNEEAGEVTKAVLQYENENGSFTDVHDELIQTAAMCIRMLLNLSRNTLTGLKPEKSHDLL